MGQHGMAWTKTAKDRESWRTLVAEGHLLQWKDTAYDKPESIIFSFAGIFPILYPGSESKRRLINRRSSLGGLL